MKEKIQCILTNKFFIIALVFIAILFSFVSNCFAYSGSLNGNDFEIGFSDISSDVCPYVLILSNFYEPDTYMYWIYVSDEPLSFDSSEGYYNISSSGTAYYCRCWASLPASNISISINSTPHITGATNGVQGSFVTTTISSAVLYNGSPYINYCNYTIVDDYTNEVVFQGAPAQGGQQGETQGIQALTLEQVEEIPQSMTEVLQVILPIGLLILGIGLVIYLMRYLILRLM